MNQTKAYLKQIITTPINVQGEIVVPLGEGAQTVQRVRTELSRVRGRLTARGMKFAHFKIRTMIKVRDEKDVIEFMRTSYDQPLEVAPSDLENLLAEMQQGAPAQ